MSNNKPEGWGTSSVHLSNMFLSFNLLLSWSTWSTALSSERKRHSCFAATRLRKNQRLPARVHYRLLHDELDGVPIQRVEDDVLVQPVDGTTVNNHRTPACACERVNQPVQELGTELPLDLIHDPLSYFLPGTRGNLSARHVFTTQDDTVCM